MEPGLRGEMLIPGQRQTDDSILCHKVGDGPKIDGIIEQDTGASLKELSQPNPIR